MKIKRFTASSTRAALDLIKEEQGPDAVILSSKPTEDGVEVVAATDYDEALLHQSGIQGTSNKTDFREHLIQEPRSEIGARLTKAPVEDSVESEYQSLRKEFGSLRSLVQNQISQLSWVNLSHDKPEQAALIRSLTGIGLSGDVVASLARDLDAINDPANAWREALALFARRIPIKADDTTAKGGRFAFVGTTGVGKTTTVSKLATRFVMQNSSLDLGLVSYEPQAMAAPDQLLRTGSILGVPVQQARGPADLRDTLSQLDSKKLVLIDTAGRSPRDPEFDRPTAGLVDPTNRLRSILTIAGGAQEGFQRETVERYKHLELDSVAITKLDEATNLGGILSTLIREKLKISYITEGQQLNKGIRSAHKQRAGIASRAVSLAKKFRDIPENSEIDVRSEAQKLLARA